MKEASLPKHANKQINKEKLVGQSVINLWPLNNLSSSSYQDEIRNM